MAMFADGLERPSLQRQNVEFFVDRQTLDFQVDGEAGKAATGLPESKASTSAGGARPRVRLRKLLGKSGEVPVFSARKGR